MRTFMMNKPWKTRLAKATSVMAIAALFVTGCKDNDRDLEDNQRQLDSLANELAAYKHTADSLKALIEKGDIAADYPIYFGKEYDSIEDPKQFIENSLKEHPEMIPLKPEVGGTMAFRKVKVLTRDWILGIYDDGHVEGKSIFQYRLQPDGKLKFTHVTSAEPQE